MNLIMVDVEADGPCPGLYSMTEFAAVSVEAAPQIFHVELFLDSIQSDERTLKAMGWTREGLIIRPNLIHPNRAMRDFKRWLTGFNRPVFISDNNGFDWQFINYYFHKFCGENPFGHSSMNANNLYKGLRQNMRESFKKFRKTQHDHNPVNDALGNVEAMLQVLHDFPSFAKGIET